MENTKREIKMKDYQSFSTANEYDLQKRKEELFDEIKLLEKHKEDFIFPPLYSLPSKFELNEIGYLILSCILKKRLEFTINEIISMINKIGAKFDKVTIYRQIERFNILFCGNKVKSKPTIYKFPSSRKRIIEYLVFSYKSVSSSVSDDKLLYSIHHIWFKCKYKTENSLAKCVPKEHWIFFEDGSRYRRRCEDATLIIHTKTNICQLAIYNVIARNEEEARTVINHILKTVREIIETKLTKGLKLTGDFQLTRDIHVTAISSRIAKSYSINTFRDEIDKILNSHKLILDKSRKNTYKDIPHLELEGMGWSAFNKIANAEAEFKHQSKQ